MKKIILLINLLTSLVCRSYSQGTTYYGNNAGIVGAYNSFFGENAGRDNAAYFNTGLGYHAMEANTTGRYNTAVGPEALRYGGEFCTAMGYHALYLNAGPDRGDPGLYNTAIGHLAMFGNSTGDYGTAVGVGAMGNNRFGSYNTGIGVHALNSNWYGEYNTATGAFSLWTNYNGHHNTANGYFALYSNSNGTNNIAIGNYSLYTNSSGTDNIAGGYHALYSNTTGNYNTSFGSYSMNANVTGGYNTAEGYYALADNTTGSRNNASGFRALDNNTSGSYNTAQGAYALNYLGTGNYNSAVGYYAGPTIVDLSNTTAIGYLAVPTASNQVRIGNTSVNSIGGQVEWTAFSDGRFKKDIKEDVSGLEFINHLRPVSYVVDKAGVNRFLHVTDSASSQAETKSIPMRQTGFIAQEVEALVKKTGYVFSGVDAPKNENDPYGIRYAAFVVPLVKAVQELTAKIEEQEKKAAEQEQKLMEQDLKIEYLSNQLDSKSGIKTSSSAVLLQNNPNPFTAETEIKMTLPENVGHATITIYNLEGKQMKSIRVNDRGEVKVKLLGNELSAGMYLYSLIADGKVVDTKRMILTQ